VKHNHETPGQTTAGGLQVQLPNSNIELTN